MSHHPRPQPASAAQSSGVPRNEYGGCSATASASSAPSTARSISARTQRALTFSSIAPGSDRRAQRLPNSTRRARHVSQPTSPPSSNASTERPTAHSSQRASTSRSWPCGDEREDRSNQWQAVANETRAAAAAVEERDQVA